MNPLPQKELAALLGEGCFLRRAKGDDALFVSDAPRRFPKKKLAMLERTLAQSGFACALGDRGLWRIDLTQARYRSLFEAFQGAASAPFPENDKDLDVYALARLLAAHPAPWDAQPAEALRAVLKRCAYPAEMAALAPRLLAGCAEKLRKHQSLPYAAAGLLAARLREAGEEERP